MSRGWLASLFVVAVLVGGFGCAPVETEESAEVSSEVRVCPVTALCIDGYAWDRSSCRCKRLRAERTCSALGLCIQGYTWDAHRCRCVRDGGNTGATVECGPGTCPASEGCCNASCGICGEVCIQIACAPATL
jgi:hypothetical protein